MDLFHNEYLMSDYGKVQNDCNVPGAIFSRFTSPDHCSIKRQISFDVSSGL